MKDPSGSKMDLRAGSSVGTASGPDSIVRMRAAKTLPPRPSESPSFHPPRPGRLPPETLPSAAQPMPSSPPPLPLSTLTGPPVPRPTDWLELEPAATEPDEQYLWGAEESGIAETPPDLPWKLSSPSALSEGTSLRAALELARSQLVELQSIAARFKASRDEAMRQADAARDQAAREIATLTSELRVSQADAERARAQRRETEKRAVAKLDRFARKISSLEESVAAMRQLLAHLD